MPSRKSNASQVANTGDEATPSKGKEREKEKDQDGIDINVSCCPFLSIRNRPILLTSC